MKRSHLTRSIWAATLALFGVATLALAACGGSDTTASSSPSAAASVATTPVAVQTPTLRVRIPGKNATFAEMKQMYEYDRSESLAFKETGTIVWVISGVQGEMIEYTSAGCTVPGVLVIPEGEGPFPVVLCAPGGTCSPGLHSVDQAALAHMGIASLAITPPDSRAPNVVIDAGRAVDDIKGNARYVVDLRRALDLLETLPQVDSKRIGFVGESWGGATGALLAGVDERIKAYVLTYAGGSIRGLAPRLDGEVQDPAEYVAHNRGAAFLFQYTKEDFDDGCFAPRRIAAMFAAAPKPKLFKWVPGGHGEMFSSAQGASRFHRLWLEKYL
jgi:dienelactone hydrolase